MTPPASPTPCIASGCDWCSKPPSAHCYTHLHVPLLAARRQQACIVRHQEVRALRHRKKAGGRLGGMTNMHLVEQLSSSRARRSATITRRLGCKVETPAPTPVGAHCQGNNHKLGLPWMKRNPF